MPARFALMINRLALGIWVGAVAFLFVAGLAVVEAMPGGRTFVAQGDAELRISAGDIVGRVFREYYAIAVVLDGIALTGALVSRQGGLWGKRQFVVHVWLLVAMLGVVLADAVWVYGKVHAVAQQIPAEGLQPGSALSREFWKWHGLSMLLSCVVLACGVVAAGVACFPGRETAKSERAESA